jgi:TetR/AcrR family transcriptional regulator, repressor for uid operon
MTMNPSSPPPARLPLAERRRRILETAVQVYSQQGFHQTGMRQLCTALGMSAGALYRYFPGKEAIIAGLVEMDREMVQQNLRSLPPGVSFIATLLHMVEVVMGDLQTNEGLLAIWSEIASEATRNPAVAALLSSHYQHIETLLATLATEALKRGELRPGTDPLAIARFIMATHDGMMTRRAIDRSYPLKEVAMANLTFFAHAVGAALPSHLKPKPPAAKTATKAAAKTGRKKP